MTELPYLESLKSSSSPDNLQELLSQTVVLKLNGGLGTSMGLEKAKSLLVVKDGKTFLDLIAEQIKYTRKQYKSNVRFVLMNSFSTSDDTKAYLKQAHKGAGAGRWGLGWGRGVRLLGQEVWSQKDKVEISVCLAFSGADLIEEEDVELLQNASTKVDAATLKPAEYPENPDMEWCAGCGGDGKRWSALGGGRCLWGDAGGLESCPCCNVTRLGTGIGPRECYARLPFLHHHLM